MKTILVVTLVSFLGVSFSAYCDDPDGLKIIDAHTHTIFDGKSDRPGAIPQTEEEYFKEMKEAGVVGTIAHSLQGGKHYHDLKSKNVVHCYGVDTRIDRKALEADLKSGKFGCIKIYLGYVHQFASNKNYTPAYELAEKYKVPVVFHTGDTDSSKALLKYADPLTVDEVAVKYPKVNFVIAHAGNPWIQSAAEVAYKNPNVYLDGSAFLVGDIEKASPEKLETYVIQPLKWIFGYMEDPQKLMFGTDWPLTRMKPYIALFKKAIPKEHWKAVFHDNAARVFKLNF